MYNALIHDRRTKHRTVPVPSDPHHEPLEGEYTKGSTGSDTAHCPAERPIGGSGTAMVRIGGPRPG